MVKRKSSRPAWSDVKASVVHMEQRQLVQLIGDLYRLSKENKDFLHARFSIGDDPLKPYKKIIDECMYPDVMSNSPIRIQEAKRAISNYSKAIGDQRGEAELMIYFVERGNAFTLDLGDIDEGFYDALVRMYDRAIAKILKLPEEEQNTFQVRMKEIMDSSDGIGWGYHDDLCDLYYDGFEDDE